MRSVRTKALVHDNTVQNECFRLTLSSGKSGISSSLTVICNVHCGQGRPHSSNPALQLDGTGSCPTYWKGRACKMQPPLWRVNLHIWSASFSSLPGCGHCRLYHTLVRWYSRIPFERQRDRAGRQMTCLSPTMPRGIVDFPTRPTAQNLAPRVAKTSTEKESSDVSSAAFDARPRT